MPPFTARQHRLQLPQVPKSDDPAVLKAAMTNMQRIVQDEFNRLAADFYNFKKTTYEAAIIPLKGVAAIVVTPTQFSMSAEWENPQQDEITPTHVRVRILEITPNDWAEYTYPINSWEFFGLDPATQYTFQVQLVARFESTDTFISTTRNCPSVPVLRIAESDIKSKIFNTLAGVGPPTDAGTNTEIDFTFPDTDGTPGTVGSGDCWWEYGFQHFEEAGVGGDYEDIGSLTEVDGDIGAVTVDLSAAPFDDFDYGLFRMKYREVCNGVDGEWIYTPGFAKYLNDQPCGDLTQSNSATTSPFSNADWFTVIPCMENDSWLKIEDGISGEEYQKHVPGYKAYSRSLSEWTLFSDDTSDLDVSDRIWVPQLTNSLPLIGSMNATSDFTIAIEFYLSELDLGVGPLSWNILNLGNKIKMNIQQSPTDYDVIVNVPREGGGSYELRAPGLLPDEWNNIFYVHDVSDPDGRVLYHNSIEVARSTSAADNDFDAIDTSFALNTFNLMRTRKIYGWLRALDDSEIPTPFLGEYYPPSTDPVTSGSIWLSNPGGTVTIGDSIQIYCCLNPASAGTAVSLAAGFRAIQLGNVYGPGSLGLTAIPGAGTTNGIRVSTSGYSALADDDGFFWAGVVTTLATTTQTWPSVGTYSGPGTFDTSGFSTHGFSFLNANAYSQIWLDDAWFISESPGAPPPYFFYGTESPF